MKILKNIIYRGCLKDIVYFIGGILFFMLPIITKAVADFIIYKLGV